MELIERIRRKSQVVKGVLYARFSSDMQREESIEAQVRAIRQFADANNIIIVGEYFDRAKSGTGTDREQFQKMIRDSAKKNFDIVLVHKVDRFARNRNDSMGARIQLKRNGISVISVTQLYDSESPEGIMMEAMLEAMAEYYSKNLATEVEKGKRENALKGKHVGGCPPLGYDVDRESMKLVINQHEASAVKMIFQMVLDGKGYGHMINQLRAKGFKTKRGNDFGKNSLYEVIRNEKYTGTYIYSKTAAKDIDGKFNRHKHKDFEDIIRVENAVPVIIERHVFDKVQELMAVRSRTKARHKAVETYLLSGMIICGECGSIFAGNRRKANSTHPEYVSYRCTKKNSSSRCMNREIRREDIEDHVLSNLASLVFDESVIPQIVDDYNGFRREQNKDAYSEIQKLSKNIKVKEGEISNVVNAISATGSLALANRLKQLEAEKAILDCEITELEVQLRIDDVDVESMKAAFRKARSMLQERSLPNMQRLLDAYVEKVYLFQDRVEIVYNFGFSAEIFKEKPHRAALESNHDAVIPHEVSQREDKNGGEGGI